MLTRKRLKMGRPKVDTRAPNDDKNRCQCVPNCPYQATRDSPFCAIHKKHCARISPLSGSEPPYEPAKYNDDPNIKDSHNCFAYAFGAYEPPDPAKCKEGRCDVPFHQPGRASGFPSFREFKRKLCPDLVARLLGDMPWLKIVRFEDKCEKGWSKVALVIDPRSDYHFYRQDSNGYWSHKPGGTAVTNRDASGRLIYDPALADRNYSDKNGALNYTNFCTYLSVPRFVAPRAKRGGSRTDRKRGGSRKGLKRRKRSTRRRSRN
jgi:hypothetical protein